MISASDFARRLHYVQTEKDDDDDSETFQVIRSIDQSRTEKRAILSVFMVESGKWPRKSVARIDTPTLLAHIRSECDNTMPLCSYSNKRYLINFRIGEGSITYRFETV